MDKIKNAPRFLEAVMNEFWEMDKEASERLDGLLAKRQSQVLRGELNEDRYCDEWSDTIKK